MNRTQNQVLSPYYWRHNFKTSPPTLICMSANTSMSIRAVGCWKLVGNLIWLSIFTHLLSEPHPKPSAMALLLTSPLQNQPSYVGIHVYKHSYEFQGCRLLETGWKFDLTVHFHFIKQTARKSKCWSLTIDLTTSKPALLRWYACVQALLWVSGL